MTINLKLMQTLFSMTSRTSSLILGMETKQIIMQDLELTIIKEASDVTGLFAVGHFAVGNFAVRTLRRTDLPYGHFAVRKFHREDTSP